jgi:hypothetical protein
MKGDDPARARRGRDSDLEVVELIHSSTRGHAGHGHCSHGQLDPEDSGPRINSDSSSVTQDRQANSPAASRLT